MKLLWCLKCNDIFNITLKEKKCSCGETKGQYLDEVNAQYSGEFAVPLGFSNPSIVTALSHWKKVGSNPNFTAFFIPVDCSTFRRVK